MDGKKDIGTSIAYWNGVSDTWQTRQPDRLWRKHSDAVNARLLASWLPRTPAGVLLKTDIFDETTGRGITMPQGTEEWITIGIDISSKMLDAARMHDHRLALAAADIRHLPFAPEAFDVVFSNSTLDHFPDRRPIIDCLKTFHRVLKPGGTLILTIDNPVNPVMAIRSALPTPFLDQARIVPYYTGKTLSPGILRSFLRDTGFDVVHLTAVLHCPRILAVQISRLLDRWAPERTRQAFLDHLLRFERLADLPTRFVTGYFTAVCCTKQ